MFDSAGDWARRTLPVDVRLIEQSSQLTPVLIVPMFTLLRRLHLILGILGIIAFLATGQYMDRFHDHLRGSDDTTRMLFRSTHIYILLASVTNAMTGLYLRPTYSRWRRALQLVGSLALLAGPPLFLIGFCREPYLSGLARPWSRPAIYLALGGVVLHLVAAIPDRPRNST